MSEKIEAIGSRELAKWLFSFLEILQAEQAKAQLLGIVHADNLYERIEQIRDVARWLYDTKFEVRDPWRLHVAIKDVLTYREHMAFKTTLAAEKMHTLQTEFETYKGNL